MAFPPFLKSVCGVRSGVTAKWTGFVDGAPIKILLHQFFRSGMSSCWRKLKPFTIRLAIGGEA
jgi:hypothetical protein